MSNSTVHPLQKIYLREIEEAQEQLELLKKDGFYSIPPLKWWLLKQEKLYEYSKDNWKNGSCFGDLPGSLNLKGELSRFNDLYDAIKEIVELYSYEKYFREELSEFEKVRDNSPALLQWLKKNEKLGTEDFMFFWTEWLEEDNTVKPFILGWSKLDVKFKSEEWKSTIRFCEVFNEIYWTSDACPDIEN